MREVWVSTDVSSEPVSSAEAKLFAKIPSTADDTVVAYQIKSAREEVEHFTGCSLAEKTLTLQLTEIPEDGKIELPYGPVRSITSVMIVDDDHVTTTSLDSGGDYDYYITGTNWQTITLKVALLPLQVLKIVYVAGYGATGCPALPSALKECILKAVATNYQFRENYTEGMAKQNEWQKKAAQYRRGI